IWAEMLEDRKFYFPIAENYDPYKSLKNTPFPVVGASPWEIVGKSSGVEMTKHDPFVGEQTPKITAGNGIRQHDLGVVKGKKYVGYVWLKAADGEAGPVEISLSTGVSDGAAPHKIESLGSEYKKHDFSFTAGETTDKATLELKVAGDKPVLV